MNSDEFQKLLDLILEIRDMTVDNTSELKEHARRSTASEGRLKIVEDQILNMLTRDRALTLLWKGLLGLVGFVALIGEIYYYFIGHG